MRRYLFIGLAVVGLLLPTTGHTDFDRDDCYGDCRGMPLRIQFGQVSHEEQVVPMVQGNYDACMQECDRKYWAQFDGKTKGIKSKDKNK